MLANGHSLQDKYALAPNYNEFLLIAVKLTFCDTIDIQTNLRSLINGQAFTLLNLKQIDLYGLLRLSLGKFKLMMQCLLLFWGSYCLGLDDNRL